MERRFDIDPPKGQSAFLWGARKTGKSTYLRARFPSAHDDDFLQSDLPLGHARRPSLLREGLEAQSGPAAREIVILDEVHWLIENQRRQFVLCGSSARKLKRGSAAVGVDREGAFAAGDPVAAGDGVSVPADALGPRVAAPGF